MHVKVTKSLKNCPSFWRGV